METNGVNRHLFLFCISFSIACSVIIAAISGPVNAATNVADFYYYYDERIYLSVSTEMITICFNETVSEQEKESLIRDDPALEAISDETLPFGLVLVALKEDLNKDDIHQSIERLNGLSEVKYCTAVFQFREMKLILMDEFIVRFKPDITEDEIKILNDKHGIEAVRRSPYRHNRHVLRVTNPKDKNAIEMASIYNENHKTNYATPNFIVLGGFLNTYPDDTYFDANVQWGLHNTGQNPPGGTEGADVNAPEAWDITTGSPDIVIAVIDSGVDIEHEDLSAKIWGNEAEFNGEPNVDDDDNGYVDDVNGWNFADDNNNPRGTNAHGTACAGLAAADTNNTTGVTGVCWGAKIMALNVGADIILSATAEAIDYASANGADILSNSWGSGPNSDISDAIGNAYNNGRNGKGCVVLVASGNFGGAVSYPANLSETVAVGATDEDDVRWYYSDYGPELDVVAPSGEKGLQGNIWTTDITGPNGYNPGDTSKGDAAGNYTNKFGGTSGATPEVAGLAGLILSVDPNLTAEEVRWLMRNSSDDLGDEGWDKYYGAGRINAYEALKGMSNDPCRATNPFPQDDANGISVNVDISWKPARGAFSHNVYFGTDYNDVNDANTADPNVYIGNQFDNLLAQNTLDPNTIYYWRIDEKNNQGTTKGGLLSFTTGLNSGIYYVDADANSGGDGNSWQTSFDDLQDALDTAIWSGDEIWVAEGTYNPTDTNDRDISFELNDDVAVYGGFDGTETVRDERDWIQNETILTGDINEPNDSSDNSYHVVIGAENATLDGFVITGGNANGSGNNRMGGGMLNLGVSPIVSHCAFRDNSATRYGGGVYNNNYSSSKVVNCIFVNNAAITGYGGGMLNDEIASYPVLTNCTFSGNTAAFGGGMGNVSASTVNVTNCIFWGNDATYLGNEIYNMTTLAPYFRHCDIEDCGGSDDWDDSLGTDGGGNIDADPCFVDDYRLGPNSPCIEAGDPNGDYYGQTDIDGQRRLSDSNADCNAVVDIGADEVIYPYPCSCPGDTDCNDYLNTDDSDALSAYLLEYGDPNGGWTAPIWPPCECSDLNVDGELGAADLTILMLHLWNNGDPNDKYKADCYPPP